MESTQAVRRQAVRDRTARRVAASYPTTSCATVIVHLTFGGSIGSRRPSCWTKSALSISRTCVEGNIWLHAQAQPNGEDRTFAANSTCLASTSTVSDSGAKFSQLFVLCRSDHVLPAEDSAGYATSKSSSSLANDYLAGSQREPCRRLFLHSISCCILTPISQSRKRGALRQDWPRIPLPATAELLEASAKLGEQIAALLDPLQPVEGVTQSPIRAELVPIGPVTRVGGGSIDPDSADMAVTAGWGHAGRGGITMPGRGKAVERDYTPEERDAILSGRRRWI